jgi:AcrR family transcriptional regulator
MAKHAPSDVRRHQLFSAAMEVCAEKGYHGTRINDIVERAGLSKGALYHHFRSKRHLFLELIHSMTDTFRQTMLESLETTPSVLDAVRQTMEQFNQMMTHSPQMIKGLFEFYVLGIRDPEIRQNFLKYYESLVEAGAEMIRRGQQDGLFRPDLDPWKAAWMLFTAGDAVVLLHAGMDREQQGLEAAMMMMDELLRAFSVREPPEERSA